MAVRRVRRAALRVAALQVASLLVATIAGAVFAGHFGLVSSARAESALDRAVRALDAASKGEPHAPSTTPTAPGVAGSEEAEPKAQTTPTPEAKPASPTPAGARAALGVATAENVVITSGAETYRIKRIDVTGTSLSNADLAALLDANSTEPLESRFRRISATAIDIPEILIDDPTPGSDGHIAVAQVKLAGVTAGKATAVSIGGVTFQGTTGQTKTSASIGAIEAFGVDFTQAAHVFGTVRSDESEPIRPLYDAVTITDFKLSDDKRTGFTVASVKQTGVGARPLRSDILVAKKPPAKMSKADEIALFTDFANSFEVASIDVLGVAAKGTDAKDGEPFAAGLDSFTFGKLAKGNFGGFAVRGMHFDAPTFKFDLASVEVGPFNMPPVVGGSPTPTFAGKLDVDKLAVDVLADKSKGDRMKFKLGHAGFIADGKPGEVPVRTKMTFDNVVFDLPADPGSAKPLVEMGYRHLDLSAALATSYDVSRQEMSIRNLSLRGVDMGMLGIGLNLANVTQGIVSPKPQVQKAAIMSMLVKGLTFDVVNEGLVDRAIAWKAKQDAVSVDAEKAQIIEFFGKTMPQQFKSANAKIVGEAVARFVSDPRKLHVAIISNSGLGAGSMALLSDPALLLDTLEVTATAN